DCATATLAANAMPAMKANLSHCTNAARCICIFPWCAEPAEGTGPPCSVSRALYSAAYFPSTHVDRPHSAATARTVPALDSGLASQPACLAQIGDRVGARQH